MPRYDVRCTAGHEADVVARWDDRGVPCPSCGALTERIWKASASVKGDECDFYDPNFERRFTSKAEHDRTIKEAGLIRKVKHRGTQGGDKSAHTSRWVSCPTISEDDRIAHWHATEAGMPPPAPVPVIVPEYSTFTAEQRESLSRVAARVGL